MIRDFPSLVEGLIVLFLTISVIVYCRVDGLPTIGANVFRLGEEADLEALNCQPSTRLIRGKMLN